jgi:phage shock protein C
VSERATEIANDISSSASKIRQESVRTSKTAGNKIAEGIGLAFKGFILFIAGTIAFSVLVSAIAFMVSGFSIWPFRDFLFDNSWQTFFFLGALLLAIIPGIALIVWVLRRIMKTKAYSKQIRWAVGILTTLGFASTIFLVASISRGFKSYNRNPTSKIDVPLVTPGNKLLVKVSEPEVQYTGEIPWVNIEENGFDITRDSMKYGNVKILIEKSSDSSYHAIIEKYSNGNTEKEADSRAQKIAYNYSAKDSVLDLGSHLSISKNEKFRGQRIIVRLQLPSNGTIIFDESINGKWHPFNIRINSRKRNNDYYSQRIISYSNNFKHLDYAFGERMIMRPNGDLEYVIDKNKEAEKQLKEQEKLEEKRRNDEKVREAKIEEKNKRIRNEAEYKRKEAQKLLDEAEELDEKVNIEQLPLASVFTNTLLPLNVPLYL